MFTKIDLAQFKEKKIPEAVINKQLYNLKKGFPYIRIDRPATIDDGIIKLDETLVTKYSTLYDSYIETKKILKFVPASGAASRMFKDLYSFMEKYKGDEDIENNKEYKSIYDFFFHLDEFAFFDDLRQTMIINDLDFDTEFSNKRYLNILNCLLGKTGLDYGSIPKGLIKFHKYKDNPRTATEEHLVEGSSYCVSSDNKVRIHFTISPEYLKKFEEILEGVKFKYGKKFNVKFDVTFSVQKPSTDTISVDMDNNPIRTADGNILFRPGGHGALIENLNEIISDIIFIKNIDNIVPDRFKSKTTAYKKVIGGILAHYVTKISRYMNKIKSKKGFPESNFNELFDFIENELCIVNHSIRKETDKDKIIDYFIKILNRPVRVCGMVRNEGEPGGGPFWVLDSEKNLSLQIVESSQININNASQSRILKNSTHFNPVDLVCYVKDFKGNKFDLMKFIDPKTGFISIKSKDGKELKALELPGLWNGSMANWNTIFVEVPLITFNPVKVVNDLLREEHKC
jgi:hypothetical protein